MEGNLLAAIFDAKEAIAEWKKEPAVSTDPVRLAEPPVAVNPQGGEAAAASAAPSAAPAGSPAAGSQAPPPQQKPLDQYLGDLYTVAVGGVVKKTDTNSMMRGAHVEFGITITRLCDGASRTVYKRFRDIKAFYYELIAKYEEVEFNTHIKFPNYESWLSSASSDPHSELVIRRKMDLQAFFSELFQQFPKLLETSLAVAFLEINLFPARAHSTFSHLYGSGHVEHAPVSSVPDGELLRFEHLDAPDVEYNAKKGKLVKKEVNDWQKYQESDAMSLVEFLSFAEQAKERNLLNQQQPQPQQQQ